MIEKRDDMVRRITIDPVTRISGFLEIDVREEQGRIIDAKTSGLLYRGFEKMLKGRPPLDAIYFTERICGICSTSHAIASSLALENALNITPDKNGRYLRDIIHGFEFISNHLRHFYIFVTPDFVKFSDINPIHPQSQRDFRIPNTISEGIIKNYGSAVELSRLAHEGLSVLGGKAPHNHGVFVGGVTVNLDSYKIEKIKSITKALKEFITGPMFYDMDIIARYYPEYFLNGTTYENYMSFGVFDYPDEPELTFSKPGVNISGKLYPLDIGKITENIQFSWYKGSSIDEKPGSLYTENTDVYKEGGYSFIKAARYNGFPMEVGPLARLKINGEYNGKNSTMDRNIARVMESKIIIEKMQGLIDRLVPKESGQKRYQIPKEAFSVGLIDTIRGSLGHWIAIKGGLIQNYDIITPSVWNFSPLDSNGVHGPVEKSLIGAKIEDINEPIELGRIVRSFDPCISCATHIINSPSEPIEIRVL